MTLWLAWERYWFKPSPVFDLAVVRLIVVAYQMFHLATIRPRTDFGELAALPDFLYAPLLVLRFMTLPMGWGYRPSDDLATGVFWLTLAVGVAAFIGYRTAVSLLLFALGSIFVQAFEFSFQEVHHPEALVVITLMLLAMSPAGAALSVDDLRNRLRLSANQAPPAAAPSWDLNPFARWPLLVVQWMFALIYFSAAFHKLTSSGLEWMNGWTLQYYMIQDALRWGNGEAGIGPGVAAEPGLGAWAGQFHAAAIMASWGSIVFETTFWLAVVRPRLALLYVPIGIAFHSSVYILQRAPFFSFVWLYCVFVPWSRVRVVVAKWLARRVERPVLLYDPASPRSVRRAKVVKYIDCCDFILIAQKPAPKLASASNP